MPDNNGECVTVTLVCPMTRIRPASPSQNKETLNPVGSIPNARREINEFRLASVLLLPRRPRLRFVKLCAHL